MDGNRASSEMSSCSSSRQRQEQTITPMSSQPSQQAHSSSTTASPDRRFDGSVEESSLPSSSSSTMMMMITHHRQRHPRPRSASRGLSPSSNKQQQQQQLMESPSSYVSPSVSRNSNNTTTNKNDATTTSSPYSSSNHYNDHGPSPRVIVDAIPVAANDACNNNNSLLGFDESSSHGTTSTRNNSSSRQSSIWKRCYENCSTGGRRRRQQRRNNNSNITATNKQQHPTLLLFPKRRFFALLLPGIAVLVALSRILWSFYWMHRADSVIFNVDSRILDAPQQQQQHQQFFTTTTPLLRNNSNKKNSISRFRLNAAAQRISTDNNSVGMKKNTGNLDPWTMEDPSMLIITGNDRRLERQQRTRPPPPAAQEIPIMIIPSLQRVQLWNDTVINVVNNNDSKERHQQQHDWQELCRGAGLSKQSRVIITGALLSSSTSSSSTTAAVPASALAVGPALALLMAKQCGVKHINGVDSMLPNVRRVRVAAMNVYRMLYRSIDAFTLTVPTATAGLSKRENDGLQWLQQFQATHIIHLETSTTTTTTNTGDDENEEKTSANTMWDEYMSPKAQRLYHLQNSLLSLQQLLRYCQSRDDAATTPLSLLHVTSSSLDDDHADITTTTSTTKSSSNTHTSATTRIHRMLADSYSAFTAGSVRLQHLVLPAVFGPTTGAAAAAKTTATTPPFHANNNHNSTLDRAPLLFVDDAVAAILTALQPRSGLHRMTLSTTKTAARRSLNSTTEVTMTGDEVKKLSPKEIFRQIQTTAFKLDQDHPYGLVGTQGLQLPAVVYPPEAQAAVHQVRETYGIHTTRFPCASSCNGPTSPVCEASVFDSIIPVSLAVTSACQFVVYLVNFDADLKELHQPLETGSILCRVAFIAGKSPVALNAIHFAMTAAAASSSLSDNAKAEALQHYNGKLKSNSWTLIWLPNDDESTLTDAEYALVFMEPGRFFAPSVSKAMFSDEATFAVPPDLALLRIMSRIDRGALPSHTIKEYRSGIVMSRFVEHPAESARSVALFASEPRRELLPKNIDEYAKLADATPSIAIPRRQLNFYKHASHWVQTDWNRPENESRQTIYRAFPFQWVSLGLLVHDMRMEAARTLRCSWYDEYLYWGHSNRGADELSLAYVIAKQRIEGSLGPVLDDDETWIPMLNKVDQQRVLTNHGAEAFLRIMTRTDAS